MKKLKLTLLVGITLSIGGCATIMGSKHQSVTILTGCNFAQVHNVSCNLKNDNGSWNVQTPNSVMIQKAYGDLQIDCKKDQAIASGKLPSHANAGAWGNVLFGGIVGYPIDVSTGAGFDYPSSMTLVLNPCPSKQ